MRSLVLLAVLAGSVTVAGVPQVAHAVTESQEVLVTSQWGGSGCPYNQRLIVADPFTGAFKRNHGTPNTSFGVFNEAKPFDSNRKIVALWGGSVESSQLAGVGVFDRAANAWTTSFALPTSIERGAESPHSIAVLPDGWFAVAHVGSVSGAGWGFVILFSPTGTMGNRYALGSAHGVEWDPRNGGNLYALGMDSLNKYTYDSVNHTLSLVTSYDLPGTSPGGHDLRRRRFDNKYSVTTNGTNHIFDPATGLFSPLTKDNGSALPTGLKSIDQRYDGLFEYNWYNNTTTPNDYFNLSDGRQAQANFCSNFYKAGRWLYDQGVPDFDGGGTSTPTWSPTFTVGGGANSWWIEIYASDDVVQLDVIGANGQFFMSNLTKHSWGAFGQSPPQEMPAGTLIKLVGRRSDGASAGSVTFAWLQNTNPATETGWNAAFTIHQCNSKLEATISSAATAAKVRIGTADWADMTKNTTTGRWERSPGVPIGTKYLIRAYLPTNEKSYDLIRTC